MASYISISRANFKTNSSQYIVHVLQHYYLDILNSNTLYW